MNSSTDLWASLLSAVWTIVPTAAYLSTLLGLLVLLTGTVVMRRRRVPAVVTRAEAVRATRPQATIDTGDPLITLPKGS